METMTVRSFEERILKGALNMVAPDAEIDGKGVILISSEEVAFNPFGFREYLWVPYGFYDEQGETEENMDKPLSAFGLADGGVLGCDDFLQNYTLRVGLIYTHQSAND